MQTRRIISAGVVAAALLGLAAATPVGSWILALAAPPEQPAVPDSHPRRRANTAPTPLASPDNSAPPISPNAGTPKQQLSADAKKLLAAIKAKADKNQVAETATAMPPLPVRKPKPRPPTTPEGKFRAKLDAILSPVLATNLSQSDTTALTGALRAVRRSNLQTASALRASISNPIARKLVDWFRLRAGFGTPGDYAAFLSANPTWPDRKILIARAEEQAFTSGGSAGSITAYFKQFPPRTAAGYAALASAHLAGNDKATARKLASKAWRDLSLATSLETGFLKRFALLLTTADHYWRINRLLLTDSRWRSTRKRIAGKIRRLIPLLKNKFERQKATARLAVYRRQKRAKSLMKAVLNPPPLPHRKASTDAAKPVNTKPNIENSKAVAPKEADSNTAATNAAATAPTDWGLKFQHIQLLRRQKNYSAVWKLLLSAPSDPTKLVNPDGWWKEKRAAIYQALGLGKFKIAFQLAANPGPLSINPRKDAAFLAGWIAYRHLNDHKSAVEYFKIMRDAADGPLSASKAGYWLARAAQSNDPESASAARRQAAAYIHTFYGQLARQTINPDDTEISTAVPALPSDAQAIRFNSMDAIKAAVIAARANLRLPLRRAFFNHLRYTLADEADMIMLAHLAQALDDTQMSVRIGKTGVVHKQNLYYYSYPVRPLPDYNPLRKPPEKALLLGVARQESEFNTTIKSGAGARGILQIMPITARHVCNIYKIKCKLSLLTTDHTFNTMIGSAYLADQLDDFSNSYALTLSGYNAGPGRTRQWIKRYGDPRDKQHDILDWIEEIPFNETRTYIKKVLSNIQVYRARLGNEAGALQLLGDLSLAKRGAGEQRLLQKVTKTGNPND